MKEENNEKLNKKISIIKGTSKDLKISDVRDNLTFEVHENESSKQNIIIPEKQENKTEE